MNEDLDSSYPERNRPPELRAAVEASRRYERWTLPWSAWWDPLIAWLSRRKDRKNPPWNAAHYRDWSHEELVWRIRFLQGAGRRVWLERETWRLLIAPALAVASFALGLWIGR